MLGGSSPGRAGPGSDFRQHAQVGGDAARQGAEVVAAFQARDDAPLRMAIGQRLDALGDPFVVGLDQAVREMKALLG